MLGLLACGISNDPEIIKSFFQALLNIKTMKMVREYDRWAFLCEKKKMQTDVTEALTGSLDNDDLVAVFSVLLEDCCHAIAALLVQWCHAAGALLVQCYQPADVVLLIQCCQPAATVLKLKASGLAGNLVGGI
nr:uncharacterized protein LOC109173786 [Ipomoea batatas]